MSCFVNNKWFNRIFGERKRIGQVVMCADSRVEGCGFKPRVWPQLEHFPCSLSSKWLPVGTNVYNTGIIIINSYYSCKVLWDRKVIKRYYKNLYYYYYLGKKPWNFRVVAWDLVKNRPSAKCMALVLQVCHEVHCF